MVITIVAVGLTGNGKSALCNRLLGSDGFAESDGADGETMSTEKRQGEFLVGKNRLSVQIVDTPGLGDRDERDSDHIKEMIDVIRKLRKVSIFCIVINFQSPRIDSNTKRLIQLLPACLSPGKNFWKNVVVVFTKVYRPQTKDAAVQKRLEEYQQRFRVEFGANLERIQFAFVDSKEDVECTENATQWQNIQDFARNVEPFPTTDVKVVAGGLEFEAHEREQFLRAKLDAEEKKRLANEKAHSKEMSEMTLRNFYDDCNFYELQSSEAQIRLSTIQYLNLISTRNCQNGLTISTFLVEQLRVPREKDRGGPAEETYVAENGANSLRHMVSVQQKINLVDIDILLAETAVNDHYKVDLRIPREQDRGGPAEETYRNVLRHTTRSFT